VDRIIPKIVICPSSKLAEGQYRKLKIVFEGRDDECLLLRFDGKVYAYINRCVHMPRRLDCEQKTVFDHTGRFLRCSMHGIVYAPQTGASVSTMCEGEQLRAVEVYEEGGEIGFADFRVTAFSS
jgi:nitrite reductase/ring-hydroxylating ferredoxin subunit